MPSNNLNAILAAAGLTVRDLILDLLGAAFIADFGVIDVVSADKTRVDVRHAIKPYIAGTQLDATVTKGVEILWPSSSAFSMQYDLAQGDPVLLVGLKDFVDTVASGLPSLPDVPLHYTQETMKAIPLGAYKGSAAIAVTVSGGVMTIGQNSPQPAARQGDATICDSTTDQVGMTMLTGMLGIPSLAGKVSAGSAHVKVGG